MSVPSHEIFSMLDVSKHDTVTLSLGPLLVLAKIVPRRESTCLNFLNVTIGRLALTYLVDVAALSTITTRQVQIDLAGIRMATRGKPEFKNCIKAWQSVYRMKIQQDACGTDDSKSRSSCETSSGGSASASDVHSLAVQVLQDMEQETRQTELVTKATEPCRSPSTLTSSDDVFTSLWA